MKKNNLGKLKKLSRNDLKNVNGGEGRCIPAHMEIVWDPNFVDEDGWVGGYVMVKVPKVC